MSDGHAEKYAGKTLVLTWTESFEWRVHIPDTWNGGARALETALRESGLINGSRPNVDIETISTRIEE